MLINNLIKIEIAMKNFEEWKQEQLKLGNLYYSKAQRNKGSLVGKWKIKYSTKKNNSNFEFTLSFEDYLYKAYETKLIDPSQIGNKKDQYQLGRYKDKGGYTKNNCRFITKLENIKERNTHFNIKVHSTKIAKKRIQNGTHNWMYLAKERVKAGTHNFLDVKPWENTAATDSSLEVWASADKVYKYWLESKVGSRALVFYFNFNSRSACINIIKKFKEGWIPMNDNNWLSWRENNVNN